MNDTNECLDTTIMERILLECERHENDCRVTAAQLLIYSSRLAWFQRFTTIASFVFAGVAGISSFLLDTLGPAGPYTVALCAFLAAMIPAVHAGMKCEKHLAHARRGVATFENLSERFRRARLVTAQKSLSVLEAVFEVLAAELETANLTEVRPPRGLRNTALRRVAEDGG